MATDVEVLAINTPDGETRPVLLAIRVMMAPVGKGRPRVTPAEYERIGSHSVKRKGAHAYTPKSTAQFQETVGWLLRRQKPVRNAVDDLFVYARFSVPDRQRKDLDNLLKALLDSCNGIVWRDDAQVAEIHSWLSRGAGEPYFDLIVGVAVP